MSHSQTIELTPLPASPVKSTASAITSLQNEGESITEAPQAILLEDISKANTAFVIVSVACISALSTFQSGLITVAIPRMAADVGLQQSLLLWPTSIYALVSGCTLLLSGSVADVVGSRLMYLLGCFVQGACNLGTGLSQTGTQIILFRGFGGLAISFCLPTAVSIITNTFPAGQRRNVAFACMGGGQPIGFALGLTLGGVFTNTIGWRWGFYVCAILNVVVMVIAIWTVPRNKEEQGPTWQRLASDIDWVGLLLISSSIAMLSFVFASITTSASSIAHPRNITLLVISLALIPAFVVWVQHQERLSRPALIPNSLWRSRVFTSVCICVFLTWGSFNATEQLLTFYFQYGQGLSALQSSLRFLAEPIAGAATNIAIGFIVQHVRADVIVGVGSSLSVIPPLLMALANPAWSYWAAAFPAILLVPIGTDCLFTVSQLVITASFPAKTQGLAGGVFNTVAQIGKSVGLALAAVIANGVTAKSGYADKHSPEALIDGYKAAWWFCFALCAMTLIYGVWGLRKVGKVGEKND